MQEERVYRTMNVAGVWNLVLGILITVFGALAGAAMIACGAKLLKRKSEVLF